MGWAGEEIICAGEIEKEEMLNLGYQSNGSLYLHASMSPFIPQLHRSQIWTVTIFLHLVVYSVEHRFGRIITHADHCELWS